MIFTVINIGTGYLNRPNWLLAGYSVYHRVASQGFPAGFPAHIVYDSLAISSPATVPAGRPRVYDRPAAAISAPAAVRAGRPARRDAADFEFLISSYCKTTIGQGLFEVCNIATGYAYESF